MLTKQNFVDYLSNGMPVQIAQDELDIFYTELESFINQADNEYIALYAKSTEEVILSDNYNDYLSICDSNDRVVFKIPDKRYRDIASLEIETQKIICSLFMGVIIFIEGLLPKKPGKNYESWPI